LLIGLLYVVFKPITYTASLRLLVYNRQIATGADPVILPGSVDIPLVQNQIEILRSRVVLGKVIEALSLTNYPEYAFRTSSKNLSVPRTTSTIGQNMSLSATIDLLRRKLFIRRLGMSHIVLVSFTASDPEKAARICNEVARAYLQERRHLLDELSTIRELYQGLGPSAYIVSEAEPPIRPDGVPALVIAFGAALVGVGVGALGAVLLDVLDNTIRNPEQVEYYLGLKCLGVIPLVGDEKEARNKSEKHPPGCAKGSDEFLVSAMPHHHLPVSQALRHVMAAMRDARHDLRSVGVTSAVPAEGSTTVAVNLAKVMARSGRRVLLLDCVPENRSLSSSMVRAVRHGAVEAGERQGWPGPDAAIDGSSCLHVLPPGELPDVGACPAALEEIIRKASDSFEFVVVDMPSLASGADARAAAQVLDCFLLVVKWGDTDSDLVRQAVRSAGEARSKFVGAILNMVDGHTVDRYGDKLTGVDLDGRPKPKET